VAISSCLLNLSLGSASERSRLIDRVTGNGEVWRIGLRQPVNDGSVQRHCSHLIRTFSRDGVPQCAVLMRHHHP
jgi:hypothetical protein